MSKSKLDEAMDELLLVGSMMSNVCFNVSQGSGRQIQEHERPQLKSMQERWDAACRLLAAAKAKGD